jgi:hypothetical protein
VPNLTARLLLQGLPCHIYFDLEFDKRLNKNRDADEMVDILVAVVFSALRDKYSIEAEEEWITELDSSTEGVSIMFRLDQIINLVQSLQISIKICGIQCQF